MILSNDVLLILLLSILTSPTDDNGEMDFASNTNFLLTTALAIHAILAILVTTVARVIDY